MSNLPQIRYFISSLKGAGWFHVSAYDNNDPDTDRRANPNSDEALRIILDVDTPSGVLNGGGGNDEFYVDHRILNRYGPIIINDPTGINTVIFAADTTVITPLSRTRYDYSIRLKSIALRDDDPNTVDITISVTQIRFGRNTNTNEETYYPTVREVTLTVSNVIENPTTGAITKFQFESGPLADLGAFSPQQAIDHATPVFDETSYAAEILRKDVSAATPILTVSGTDEDGGIPLSYLIAGGNDNGYFDIRGATGALVFNPNKVDDLKSDPTRQHTLTVRVHDGGQFSDVEVVITLTLEQIRYFPSGINGAGWYRTQDADSTVPVTSTGLGSAEAQRIIIDANTPTGSANQISGSDGDDEFYIEHNAASNVEINDNSGINTIIFAADKVEAGTTTSISIKSVALVNEGQIDARASVTLTITTNDGITSTTRDVRLEVAGIEENNGAITQFVFEGGDLAGHIFTAQELRDYAAGTPTFTQESYSVEISEDRDLSADNSVVTISALDTNLPRGSTLTYSIISAIDNDGDAVSIFDIDANGAITFNTNISALDRETNSKYTLTVRASDGVKHSDTQLVIDIGDVDEHPHSFNFHGTYSESIFETTIPQDGGPRGTAITFSIRDADNKVYTADDFAVHRVKFVDKVYADVGVDERFDIIPSGFDGDGNARWRLVVVPGTTLDDTTDAYIPLSIVAYDDGEAIRTPRGAGVVGAISISVLGIGLPSEGFTRQAEFGFRSNGINPRQPRVEETLTVYVTQDDVDGNGTLQTDANGNITGSATFQWYYTKGGVTAKIDGATSASYTLGEETLGAKISVDVQYTDGGQRFGVAPKDEYVRATHDHVVLKANQAPTLTYTGTPTITEDAGTALAVENITLTADDIEPVFRTGLRYSLVDAPSGWHINNISGAITFNGTLDYESILPDPDNGDKRGQELVVRVTDEGRKFNEVTIFVEVINKEEGPASLRIDLPDGENAGTLEGGEVLEVNFSPDDPDGYASDTIHEYKWYRVVDGQEETDAIHTGETYTIDATEDLSTDTKRVDIIVRSTYTDGFGKEEIVEARINYIGRDVDAQIGFTPSVAREVLAVGNNVALNVIAEDPNGYMVGAPVVYEWYRVVNGVEEATPIESTTGLRITSATALDRDPGGAGIRDLTADDISNANTRVDFIFRLTYTDGYGREVMIEERLNHIGIATPAPNTDPVFDTTTTSFDIDEGTHDNIKLHRVNVSDPEKDSLVLSLTDTAPAGYSLVDNGDGTADIFFTGTIAEGAADGTLTVQAEDLEGHKVTQDLTIRINELPEITVTGRAEIPENTDYSTTPFQISGEAGAPVTITASDGDSDTLTYSLADGTLAGFDIDPNTGAITYSGGALNFEDYKSTNGVITLVVEVSDSRAVAPTTHDVEVQITDAQEGPAAIRLGKTAPFIGDTLQVFVDVHDPEGNGNLLDADSASYQWYSKTGDNARKPISEATGATYAVPEGSAGKIFSVDITYQDGGGFSNSVTATTTTGAEEGSLTLYDGLFDGNGNQIVHEFDIDVKPYRISTITVAEFTGNPYLTIGFINKFGQQVDAPLIPKGNIGGQPETPPYWTGFNVTYGGDKVLLEFFNGFDSPLLFDSGRDTTPVGHGTADTLLPTGVIQDFTIKAHYGDTTPKTVDFQLKLFDDDDPINTSVPFVTQRYLPSLNNNDIFAARYRANLSADELHLEADTTESDYDNGIRSGTFYINDIDEGDVYELTASVAGNSITVTDGTTQSITTNLGVLAITLDSKQVDWTFTYKDGIGTLGDGATLTNHVQITVTDTIGTTTSTATATPLTFAFRSRAEGPVFTQSAYTFGVSEGTTDVGTITLSSDLSTAFSFSAGNDNDLFAIDGDGVITLTRALDFETDARQYTLTVEGSDRNGTLSTQVTINLENVDESQSTFTITGANADNTNSDLTDLAPDWTLNVAVDTPDAEGIKSSVTPTYRWFHVSNPTGDLGVNSATYTIKSTDIGEVIGVGVTYTDNSDVSVEVVQMLDAVYAVKNSAVPQLTITGSPATSLTENVDHADNPVQFSGEGSGVTITASDVDNDPLTFSLVNAPDGFDINPDTGDIVFTGVLSHEDYTDGILMLMVQVTSDRTGKSTTGNIPITVNDVQEGPAIIRLNNADPVAGDTLEILIARPDLDGNGDLTDASSATYQWYSATPGSDRVAITTDGTAATYTLPTDAVAGTIFSVDITYTDGGGTRHSLSVSTIDQDNTITIPDTATAMEAGDGADTITDGDGDDTITGAKGDDTIDLGANGGDADTIKYAIGDQTAKDGGDDISNFERGKDKFVFSLESNAKTQALTDLASFLSYVAGDTSTRDDDQFNAQINVDTQNGATVISGITLHFYDGVFYDGGRISLPILEVSFSEGIAGDDFITMLGGVDADIPSKVTRNGIITDLDYLNAIFGGSEEFEAIGFEII